MTPYGARTHIHPIVIKTQTASWQTNVKRQYSKDISSQKHKLLTIVENVKRRYAKHPQNLKTHTHEKRKIDETIQLA